MENAWGPLDPQRWEVCVAAHHMGLGGGNRKLADTKEASPCWSRAAGPTSASCRPLSLPLPQGISSLHLCAHSRKWPCSPRMTQFSGSVTSSQLQSLRGEAHWPIQVKCPLLVQSTTTGGRVTENKHGSVISHYVLVHFLF